MRRFLAFAALMLGLASCQTEPEGLNVQVGDEVDATITVAVADVETRAGSNSAKGVFDNGVLDGDATMRYVMRIYDEDGKPTEKRYVDFSDEKSVTFAIRLAPKRAYTFVVWADVVLSNKDVDNHYHTYDLENITIIDTEEHPWKAMDESRDAFTGFATVDSYTSASTIQIPLTRPFAKLRVKTNDLADLALLNIAPAKATVTYTTDLSVAFNAVVGKAKASDRNANTITKTVSYDTDAYEGDSATLFTDYLIVDEGVVKFTMDVKQASGRLIKSNNFNTDIPVKRNCLTTISGNVLTDGNGISVNIEESEEETEWPRTMAEKLAYVGIVGGEVTLTESVELSKPVVVNAGVNAVINLNGYDIINTTKSDEYGAGEAIIVYGNATINGEGTVAGCTRAVWARGAENDAVVNIYGGKYTGCEEGFAEGGCSVIYASGDNVINIHGGTFEALAADKTSYADKTNGVYAALNVQDNHGTINVCGGTFKNFNPAQPGTEPASWMQTHPNGFVVLGYKSALVKDSTADYVVSEIPLVTTSDELLAAVAQVGYVKLGKDISLEARISVPTGADVYLDMNGKSICVEEDYTDERVIYVPAGSALIIDGNGTIEAHTPNPVIFAPFGNLVIENGTFIRVLEDGYTGTISSMFLGTKPGGWEKYGVTINGGYFDSGYYGVDANYIDRLIAGEETLVETEADIAKRGQSGDSNETRTAVKSHITKMFNKSNNYFRVYGGTFVGANPAWGDEGCMLPTTPQYLRPWSYYQGALLDGQEFNENGIVLPEGYEITKSTHEDGRPIYTVTYNK